MISGFGFFTFWLGGRAVISYGCVLKCLVKFAGLAGFQVCLWLDCDWCPGFGLVQYTATGVGCGFSGVCCCGFGYLCFRLGCMDLFVRLRGG